MLLLCSAEQPTAQPVQKDTTTNNLTTGRSASRWGSVRFESYQVKKTAHIRSAYLQHHVDTVPPGFKAVHSGLLRLHSTRADQPDHLQQDNTTPPRRENKHSSHPMKGLRHTTAVPPSPSLITDPPHPITLPMASPIFGSRSITKSPCEALYGDGQATHHTPPRVTSNQYKKAVP